MALLRPDIQIDEYPQAMFLENGGNADLKAIDAHDNEEAGATIGNKCRKYPNGTRVEIVVVP